MEIKKLILICSAVAFIFQNSADAKVKIHTKYNSIAYQQKEKEKKQNQSFYFDSNSNYSINNSQNEERLSRKIERLQDRIDELKDTIRELRKEGAAKDRRIEALIEENNKQTEKYLETNIEN